MEPRRASRHLLHWPRAAAAHPAGWAALGVGLVLVLGVVARLSLVGAVGPTRVAPTPLAAPTALTDAVPDGQDQPTAAATDDTSPFAQIADVPTPAPRSGMQTYTVQSGDVLWQIAQQFNLRPETILWANDVANPDLLQVGEKLTIPPTDGVMYTVQPGDHLAEVANRYGVDLGAVVADNGLSSVDQIQAGQDVFLPGGRPMLRSDAPASIAQSGTSLTNSGDQVAAMAAPPIPLPDNIADLLASGWLVTQQQSSLYRTSDANASVLHDVPSGASLERLDGFSGGRIEVRDPGDGTTRQAMTGWVSALDLGVGRAPRTSQLPLSYPADTAMDIFQVFAPYRSQLDGSAYAEANCGPTSVGMALDAFGVHVSSGTLRAEALNAQGMWGNGVGTVLPALASVVRQNGLSTYGLYEDDGSIHRWTADDLTAQLQAGRPVIVQVRYRSLPGRGNVAYYGDHYIVVIGATDDGFLYNDPINVDGLGWDRVMPTGVLMAAMNASDARYAHAAVAVGP